jgi:LysM repeat protein
MANTYTVKKGDTLSEIAAKFKSEYGYSNTYTYLSKLVEINDILDPDRIVVGQTIQLSGSASTPTTNTTSRATIKMFGLQSNTDRTVYVSWAWDKSNTKEYKVIWYYATGDGLWFVGNDGTESHKQSVYSAPSNATRVKVKVKPISTTHTVNKKEVEYWTAGWSTEKIYDFKDNPPTKPSTPVVTIEKYNLTAELNNLGSDMNATEIEFQVVKNDKSVFRSGKVKITKSSASYSCKVGAGAEYKVRCRSVDGKRTSDWSDYSDNTGTMPSAVDNFKTCKATSATSVFLEWKAVKNATTYDIEYTTKKSYFNGSDQTTTISSIETAKYEKTGLTAGTEYFFRVRAVNDKGSSAWSVIKSVVIGKAPSAPTTWSSTTTAIAGDPLILYWVHNGEDESSQTNAILEIYTNGVKRSYTIKNTTDEDLKDKTSSYSVSTAGYNEGVKMEWRVKTAGVTLEYGDWSILRTVDIYAPPTLELSITDYENEGMYTLTSFPFYVSATAGPNTQNPIGYHLSIIANSGYETVDEVGNATIVTAGDEVYSKYFDITTDLVVELSASNLSLENNIDYTVICSVTMDSGLTAEARSQFTVGWTENEYEPNAEIFFDEESLTTSIQPFCKDVYGRFIENVVLSVYRREFDGKFTELATDLINTNGTFITDPHPALDYARYRIIAKTTDTGTISYYDMPGYPINEKSVIIQWDEDWSEFETSEESELEQQPWAGSMLKLPYNIDVSDSYRPDVELVEYIGREHPVSYYGTQRGVSATWNVAIAKSDIDTLYALRRLSTWMGDVYVREPSGSGYWANITVSFSQKHTELTIPVTLSITRVEGGM